MGGALKVGAGRRGKGLAVDLKMLPRAEVGLWEILQRHYRKEIDSRDGGT